MAITPVNIGSSPNDGTGDVLRDAFDKLNANVSELDGRVTTAATQASAAQTSATSAQTTADNAVPLSQKGTANGVASLDATGKIPPAQIALAASDVGADAAGTATAAVDALDAQLAIVAKTGDYNDLSNKPEIVPVNADWNATSGLAQILNKPTIVSPVNADWNASGGLAQILNKPAITTFGQSILSATDAAAGRAAMGAVGLTGNETVAGDKTYSGIIIPHSTKGIKGTTTNDDAQAGSVGEVFSSQVLLANRMALTHATGKSIASISPTAGHWHVFVQAYFYGNGSTPVDRVAFSIGEVTNTFNADNGVWYVYPSILTLGSTGVFYSEGFVSLPYKKASTFTLYLVVLAGFTSGAVSAYGSIVATRTR